MTGTYDESKVDALNRIDKLEQRAALASSNIEVLEQRLDELILRIKHLSQRASVGEADIQTYANVEYGGTINLGNRNFRKINISIHGLQPKDIDTTLDELEQKIEQKENVLRRSQSQ